jgi:hypothetical protein
MRRQILSPKQRMVKTRRTRRSRASRASRRFRRQSGGGDAAYGFTGSAGLSAGGVPFETRGASYTQCGWDVRPAPPDVTAFKTTQFGGSRKRRASRRSRSLTRASRRFRQQKQKGGACGCMAAPPMQSGGAAFGFNLNNDNGKVYSSLEMIPCPPTPRASQIGGSAADELGIVSYKSGYGFGPASVYSTASAHYLDKLPYDRTVMTGGKRSRRRRRQ